MLLSIYILQWFFLTTVWWYIHIIPVQQQVTLRETVECLEWTAIDTSKSVVIICPKCSQTSLNDPVGLPSPGGLSTHGASDIMIIWTNVANWNLGNKSLGNLNHDKKNLIQENLSESVWKVSSVFLGLKLLTHWGWVTHIWRISVI